MADYGSLLKKYPIPIAIGAIVIVGGYLYLKNNAAAQASSGTTSGGYVAPYTFSGPVDPATGLPVYSDMTGSGASVLSGYTDTSVAALDAANAQITQNASDAKSASDTKSLFNNLISSITALGNKTDAVTAATIDLQALKETDTFALNMQTLDNALKIANDANATANRSIDASMYGTTADLAIAAINSGQALSVTHVQASNGQSIDISSANVAATKDALWEKEAATQFINDTMGTNINAFGTGTHGSTTPRQVNTRAGIAIGA